MIPSPKINLPGFLRYGKYLVLLIMVILIPFFFGIGLTPEETTPEDFFFCNLCPAGTLEAFIPATLIPPEATDELEEVGLEDFVLEDLEKETKDEDNLVSAGSKIIISLLKSPRVWILIILLAAFVFIRRLFCRVFCPLGAIFALFNKVSLYHMVLDKEKCTECNTCYKQCPVDHKIYTNAKSPECIRCLECQKKCPAEAVENQYF